MKISVELSMYPLKEHYEKPILNFIAELNKQEDIQVRTNGMSTQVFGEYDRVMELLQQEIKSAFEGGVPMSIVCKMLNMDTSAYQHKKSNSN